MESRSCSLHKRLLEVAVVVGVDEVTGLHRRVLEYDKIYAQHLNAKQNRHRTKQEKSLMIIFGLMKTFHLGQNTIFDSDDDQLFKLHFKAQLLDIISGTQDGLNDVVASKSATLKKSKEQNLSPPLSATVGKKNRNKISRTRSVRRLRKQISKEEAISVSTDFLNNLPYVCLPYDSRVFREAQQPETHFAVLTDVSGFRHYAVVLRVYQTFFATKNPSASDDVSWSLCLQSAGSVKCYTPLCICLIASVPYFDVLKDALSSLCKEWRREPTYPLFRRKLEKFVTCLSVVPCPPPGIRVTFTLHSCTFTMFPPEDVNQQNNVVDIDLSVPLLVFMQNYQTLLQVLACILLEQRVVFVSKNHSLIVIAMQALLHYIAPFQWPHQYVPLLFSDRIDFVACPGIFLMGCHAMHKEKIKEIENDQILVDLDTGEVLVCASYEWQSSANDSQNKPEPLNKLESYLPLRITETVCKRLSELSLFDTEHLKYPTLMTFAELNHHRTKKKYEMNMKIQNVFMNMMVDLFSNTLYHLDHEINQFKIDEFLENVTAYDHPFYIKVVRTYMFKKFVKERLRRTDDNFNKVANARLRRNGADKIRARSTPPQSPTLDRRNRTFGKVRSSGDTLIPSPRRPTDARSSSLMTNQRRSSESRDGRPSSTRVYSKDNRMNSSVFPISVRTDTKETRAEKTLSSPVQRRISSSEYVPTAEDSMANDVPAENTHNNIDHLVLNLPAFPDVSSSVAGFYKSCVTRINILMNDDSEPMALQSSRPLVTNCQHIHLASCLLLRGLFNIAAGHMIEGLEDLHETSKEDYRMFPRSIIKDVVACLPPEDRQLVRRQTFYKGDEFYEEFEGVARNEIFRYSDDELPYKPLDKSSFSSIVESSSVTSNSDVVDHLFRALSTVSLQVIDGPVEDLTVDPETFSGFFSTWKQCRSDCEIALRSIFHGEHGTSGLLRESEAILKVSSVVTSDRGTGRLILTSEKILFMTELYEECKLNIRLAQIDEVRIIRQKNLFRSFNAINFMQKDEVLFRATMKTESELWKMMVDEMRIGRMLAKEMKDHQLTLDTAVQNVGVAEAFYEFAVDEELMDAESAVSLVKRLCNFTQLFESGKIEMLPVETNQMLLLTIDLSPKEAKKSKVNAILYAPAVEIEDSPRIWVTLSSSTIRMIDTTSWQLDSRPIKDCTDQLTSLCMNDRELWVGSSDKTINVIDCESLRRTRVLHEHTDPVVAVLHCQDLIVSASSCGEIIFWDKDQKKRLSSFTMSPPHNNLFAAASLDSQTICCCCSISISLFTMDGSRRQMLTLGDFYSSRIADSKITCFVPLGSDEIWAGDSNGYVYMWRRKRSEIFPSPPLGDRHHRFKPFLSGLLCDVTKPVHITCLMTTHDGKVWVGNSVGDIIVLTSDTLCQEQTWKAHEAAVTSLIQVENRYVISGSDSKDGKISLWRYEQLSRLT